MEFEKVLKGINKYLNNEIYNGMNDWQEVLARTAVSRFIGDGEKLKESLVNNGYVKTFAIMDENGDVDVDGLYKELKTAVEQKGKMTIKIPLFGSFTFTADDVDKLYNTIQGA
jgi:hypothetical protein